MNQVYTQYNSRITLTSAKCYFFLPIVSLLLYDLNFGGENELSSNEETLWTLLYKVPQCKRNFFHACLVLTQS